MERRIRPKALAAGSRPRWPAQDDEQAIAIGEGTRARSA
jgi:hypothetical protein